MSSQEKLYLKWNDFHTNLSTSYNKLREDTEFSDVTLACEDSKIIEAHRIILSASSPVFKEILSSNKNQHPIIYMKGVKYKYFTSIIEFIYHGEVTVHQEDLVNILELAEDLKLKGLAEKGNEQLKQTLDEAEAANTLEKEPESEAKQSSQIQNICPKEQIETIDGIKHEPIILTDEHWDNENFQKNIISARNSMIMTKLQKNDRTWTCTVCGRSSNKKNARQNMMEHVESIHLDTGTHPCDMCDKTFRVRRNVRSHKHRSHKQNI